MARSFFTKASTATLQASSSGCAHREFCFFDASGAGRAAYNLLMNRLKIQFGSGSPAGDLASWSMPIRRRCAASADGREKCLTTFQFKQSRNNCPAASRSRMAPRWPSFMIKRRFSGRLAPARNGVISGPAYSHEVCSAGFWPGGGVVDGPAYYSYTVAQPPGIETQSVRPAGAGWNAQLSEFILMYDDVRRAESPEETLYEFLESTYEAGARLAKWDRATLET